MSKEREKRLEPFLEYQKIRRKELILRHQEPVKTINIPPINKKQLEQEMYLLTRFKEGSNARIVFDLERYAAELSKALTAAHCDAMLRAGMILETFLENVMAQVRDYIETHREEL